MTTGAVALVATSDHQSTTYHGSSLENDNTHRHKEGKQRSSMAVTLTAFVL